MKRIASAALSAAMLTGVAAGSLSAQTTASAATYQTIHSVTATTEWTRRINAEKAKYPEKKNNKQCYWNKKWNSITGKYGDEDSYSTSACVHNSYGYCNDCKVLQMTTYSGYYYSNHYNLSTNSYGGSTRTYSQCIAFAAKLALDIWQTDVFIRYDIRDGKVQYGDGSSEDYVPKVGDILRFVSGGYEHSIFITYVNGDDIRFAQCNADNKCGIDWDANNYNGSGITQRYLRARAQYVERPAIAGDLNLNGKIDNGDASIFEDTVMYDGNPVGEISNGVNCCAPMTAYDVNGDGYVNTDDLNQIKYGSNHPDYMKIINHSDPTTCRWQPKRHISGFRFSDGCYYVKNNIGGVAWIGAVDTELKSLTLPSRVYSDKDKRWYDVNEVGYNAQGRGAGWRTCTDHCKIETLRIPDSIKRIHSFVFEEGALRSLVFEGSNPQLETIEESAFYNCKNLGGLYLTKATKLANIGDNAFAGCSNLTYIDLPYFNDHSLYFGSTANGSVFGTGKTVVSQMFVNNPNRINTAANYQHLKFKSGDINYWRNGKLKLYGRLFKVYQGEQLIATKSTGNGYLYP